MCFNPLPPLPIRRGYGDEIGDKHFKERIRRDEVDRREDLVCEQIAGNDLVDERRDDLQQHAQGRPQEHRKKPDFPFVVQFVFISFPAPESE